MKRLTAIGSFILFWGISGFSVLQDQADILLAERLFKIGEQLYDDGKYKLAADTLKRSASIFEQAKKTIDQVRASNLQAECLSNLNQCDVAAPILQKNLEIIHKHPGDNSAVLADTYYYLSRNTGGCARRWDDAIRLMQTSISIKKDQHPKDDTDISREYTFLGYIYNSKGKYDSALIFLDQAMALRTKDPKADNIELSHTMFNIAASYEGKSQLIKALELNLTSLRIRTAKLGTLHATVSNSINSIGRIYRKLGNNERALEYYRQALDIRKKTLGENHPNVAASYYEIGNLYGNLSNYHASLEFIQEGNRILESNTQIASDVLPTYFAYAGKMYGLTDDHDNAKAMIQKAVAVAEKNLPNDHPYFAIVYNIAGEYYGEAGDVDQQLKFFKSAIAIYQKSYGPGSEREADIVSKMAATNAKLDNSTQALRLYNQALSMYTARLGSQNPKVATVQLGIGDVYAKVNDLSTAQESYGLAIESIAGTENKSLELKVVRSRARIETGKTALASYSQALKLADDMAQGYSNDASRIQLEKERREMCAAAMNVAWDLYKVSAEPSILQEAFTFAEKSKATLLLENTRDQQAKTIAGVPDSLIEKERDLRIELAYYKTNLYQSQKSKDTSATSGFQKNIFASERKLEQFKSDLEKDFPSYFNLKYNKSTFALADIQKRLINDAKLVQYFVSDSAIYALVLSQDSAQFKKQIITPELKAIVTAYQKSLTDFNFIMDDEQNSDSVYRNNASKLFTLLMLPAPDNSRTNPKLIIIPDDFLAQLNFGTILWTTIRDHERRPYLGIVYAMSYAYSSAFLLNDTKDPKRSKNNFAGFAPSYKQVDYTAVDSAVHPMTALAMRSGNLPLPGATEEVNLISELMNGKSWLDEEATETNFKKYGGDYGVLHLAMHSLLNDEEPRYSELLFNRSKDVENDGYLTVAEIYNLKLNAEMVVLSSCSSGFGKIQYGEGPISLSRAFSYAGCPSVVMSLWKVPDLVTTKIMKSFYENLSKDLSKDEALRAAQADYIVNEENRHYSHPYYWAGFVVIGDTAPLTPSRPYMIYLIAGVFALVVGAIVFKRRK